MAPHSRGWVAAGRNAYPNLEGQAAALLHSIVHNHALVDRNKRLGWLATVVFLGLNGVTVTLDDDAAFHLVLEVATGALEVDGIVAVLDSGVHDVGGS